MEHKIEIIVTKLMGTHYQASCKCGWLADRSHPSRYPAKKDGERHLLLKSEES
jgi:hypothetical protein